MSDDKVVEVFDRWVEEGRADGLEQNHGDVVDQVLQELGIAPGEKILDLGCGTGWATRRLAQANAGVQAIGVDASPRMIAKADELHSFTIRARYDFGSFEALDFKDGEFDRIFSMEAIYYAKDLQAAVREAFRVLKPGGTAEILLDYYEENTASAPWADALGVRMHRLSESAWREVFERAGFSPVTTRRVVDRRGPGDPAAFEANPCEKDWESRVSLHESGTLWIHAVKPEA